MIFEIGILIVLVLINAFFAASEIALISLNDNKIKMMAEEGHKKAKLLSKLLGEPSRFLATIQIGITLAGFLASAFAADKFASQLSNYVKSTDLPLSAVWVEGISLVLITLILSYFTLVFGELVPKRLAMKKAEAISMLAATPLTGLSVIASPFVKLLTLSTNLTIRLFGIDPNDEDDKVTEEEIRMMVDVGQERGAILESERLMIENIFEFDNKIASDIMTHRTNVIAFSTETSLDEILDLICHEKFSRYPVFEKNIDNIVGILHVKDMFPYLVKNNNIPFTLEDVIRKPYLVPESKKTDDLFTDLQQNKIQLAVVIDEYGGTAGIITIEDLLEEIVGNIFDEHDVDESELQKLDDTTYLVQGSISLDDVQAQFGIGFPVDEYETLSGFMIGQLGRIPEEEEKPVIEFNGMVLKVEKADDKRILEVKACIAE